MDKMPVEVVCFAGLRNYFGNVTTVFVQSEACYSDVIDDLIRTKPDAEVVLRCSRIAVNEEFILLHEKIKSGKTIMLIPPLSGG